MKNVLTYCLFMATFLSISCSSNDDDASSNDNAPAGTSTFQATINGGTYSNYDYTLGVYEVVKGTNGNTLSINTADSNGDMITLFLNGTNGFDSGTVKEMGNVDADNFNTFATIRQASPQITYFSTSGSVTITTNRVHPTEAGHRLLSGNFNITAATIDGSNTTSMSGSFEELDFVE